MVGKGITVVRTRGTSDRACLRKTRVVNPVPLYAVYPKAAFLTRTTFAFPVAKRAHVPLRSGRDVP
ncbi:MAG: hypothetical protein ABW133_03225 [Polyangiaceae bacterium]